MAGRRKFTFPASQFNAAATSCPAMVRVDRDADLARHAANDGSNLAFVKQNGEPIKATIGYTPVLLDDVTYTVASEPNGYHWRNATGTIDRTFIGAFRHQAGAGDLIQYDHLTRKMDVYRLAAAGDLDPDDHNAVTVTVNETTGTVFAFVVDHNTDQMRIFRSSSAGDASTMVEITSAAAADIGDINEAAYPQPFWVGSTLWLSWRDANGVGGYKRFLTTTSDNGDTWEARFEELTATSDRPYVAHDSFSSDRFEIYTSRGLERENGGTARDLFHFYCIASTRDVYTTGGTLVGNLDTAPIDLDAATPILTQAAQGGFALRCHGICRDTTTGRISIGYKRVHRENQTDPWENDYGQLRWDGSSWTAEIVSIGQETVYGPTTDEYEGYLPGWQQSRYSLDECLGSFHASDRSYQIRRANRSEAGVWSFQNLTSGSESETIRPVYVRNAHEDLQVLFLTGAYDKFDSSSTNMNLCAWPNVASYGRLRALLELDHDGSTDQVVYLVVGDNATAKRPAFSSALYATGADVGRRTLAKTSDAIIAPDGSVRTMHSLAGLTVLAASDFSGHNTDETIISNYGAGGSSTDRIMQMRYSNSSPARLECVVNFSTTSSTASEATDITLTTGVKYGMGFSWDGVPGSSNLRMAANGTLSSVAGTAQGTLRNPSPSPRLRTGIRSSAGYDDTVQVFGSIDGIVILPEAKPTAWLQMATKGIGTPVYTVGEFTETNYQPDSTLLAAAVRTELAIELARLDAAVSTRATPATVRTELATELARIDAPISAAGANLYSVRILPVQSGADVTLTGYVLKNGQPLEITGSVPVVIASHSLAGVFTSTPTPTVSGSIFVTTIEDLTLASYDALRFRVQFDTLEDVEDVTVDADIWQTVPNRVTNTRAEKLDDIGEVKSLVQNTKTIEPDRDRTWVPRRGRDTTPISRRSDEGVRYYVDFSRMLGVNETLGSTEDVTIDVGTSGVTIQSGSIEKAGTVLSFIPLGGTAGSQYIDLETATATGDPLEVRLNLTIVESD